MSRPKECVADLFFIITMLFALAVVGLYFSFVILGDPHGDGPNGLLLRPWTLRLIALAVLLLRPIGAMLNNFKCDPQTICSRRRLAKYQERIVQFEDFPENFLIRRVAESSGSPAMALEVLREMEKVATIRAGRKLDLHDFEEFLRAQGARIEEARPILAPSLKGQIGFWLANWLATLSCLVIPWVLVWAAFFWIEWFATGTFWFRSLALIPFCSLLASFLALIGPLRDWTFGLLTRAGKEAPPPGNALRIYVIDELRPERITRRIAHSGWLRFDKDQLVLIAGQRSWTIPRDAVEELTPLKRTGFLSFAASPVGRFMARPVRIRFRIR